MLTLGLCKKGTFTKECKTSLLPLPLARSLYVCAQLSDGVGEAGQKEKLKTAAAATIWAEARTPSFK